MPPVDERMIPDATIVIVTHNRRDEALRAVASAVAQTAVEVLVLDDGSSDGTTEAIRREYPEARVERFEEPAVTAHLLWLGFGVRRTRLFLRGVLAGYRTAFGERHRREPVPPALYRAFRRLGYAPEQIETIEDVLPELPDQDRAQDHVRA